MSVCRDWPAETLRLRILHWMWTRALLIQNVRRARTIVTGLVHDYPEIGKVLGVLYNAATSHGQDVDIDRVLPVAIAGKQNIVGKETSPAYGVQFRVIEGRDCMCHEFFSLLDSERRRRREATTRFFS